MAEPVEKDTEAGEKSAEEKEFQEQQERLKEKIEQIPLKGPDAVGKRAENDESDDDMNEGTDGTEDKGGDCQADAHEKAEAMATDMENAENSERTAASVAVQDGKPDGDAKVWQDVAREHGAAEEARHHWGTEKDQAYQNELKENLEPVSDKITAETIDNYDKAINDATAEADGYQANGDFKEAAEARSAANEMTNLRNAMAKEYDSTHSSAAGEYGERPLSAPDDPAEAQKNPEAAANARETAEQLEQEADALNEQRDYEGAWDKRRQSAEAYGYARRHGG